MKNLPVTYHLIPIFHQPNCYTCQKNLSFVSAETNMKEFTIKSVLVGSAFGIIFGAATVYLALKAGLTVSASIPIAVMSIALSKLFLRTTILENNIIKPGSG
jgi:uncharacterized oligopeptide transporter (OPT) family protein